MSKIELLNLNGEKVKDINLKDNVWNIEPNDGVLYNHIILTQASLRQGSHNTKTRTEVSGGGRKPWRQKGTGNARQGSIRAPQWRGGGIVFGPTPEKNYTKKMNKKERRLALLSALSYKALDSDVIVVDEIVLSSNKTKDMVSVLNNLKIADKKVLVVVNELNDNVCLAARNLSNVKIVLPVEVNTLDVVSADKLLIEEKALQSLEEVLVNE